MHTSCLLLPASYFLPPASCLLLPASCFLPLTSCLLLPASYFLPPTSCLLLPASHFLPPASCFLPPASCLLPPTSCLLLPTGARGHSSSKPRCWDQVVTSKWEPPVSPPTLKRWPLRAYFALLSTLHLLPLREQCSTLSEGSQRELGLKLSTSCGPSWCKPRIAQSGLSGPLSRLRRR